MEDVQVPQYYIVKRNLNDKEVEAALYVFRITPISLVVITDSADLEQAKHFSDEVRKLNNLSEAIELKEDLPWLIIGDAELLDACYPDGSKSKVEIHVKANH